MLTAESAFAALFIYMVMCYLMLSATVSYLGKQLAAGG